MNAKGRIDLENFHITKLNKTIDSGNLRKKSWWEITNPKVVEISPLQIIRCLPMRYKIMYPESLAIVSPKNVSLDLLSFWISLPA